MAFLLLRRPVFDSAQRRHFLETVCAFTGRNYSSQDDQQSRGFLNSSGGFEVDITRPVYMVWGSNTDVGKTLVSAGLAASIVCPLNAPFEARKVLYVKPVQTGFPRDSDSRFVSRTVSEICKRRRPANGLFVSNHVLKASPAAWKLLPGASDASHSDLDESGMKNVCCYESHALQGTRSGDGDTVSELVCKTIFSWNEAISPHLAARREQCVVEDNAVVEKLQSCLQQFNSSSKCANKTHNWSIIETAGGVASPGPSGSLQCDLYRVPVFVLAQLPQDASIGLMEWFSESHKVFIELQDLLETVYMKRIQRLHDLPKKGKSLLWWPFTQHSLVPEQFITVIDSRFGENLCVHKAHKNMNKDSIVQQFDACASWWTQGPNAILQRELAREVAYATGRFGHVMYPENVYEPALHCAELLLQGVGKGWATRAYFSDNGSTAIEIAVKMAFRKFAADHGFLLELSKMNSGKTCPEFKVIALRGSYHGDTLGAMEAQAPSAYTGFLQQPWYSGRGLFLDPPTVFYHNRQWNIYVPDAVASSELQFSVEGSYDAILSTRRDDTELATLYCDYISRQLSQFSTSSPSAHVAALIIEPVIHGAGGMNMIDPLFQRMLVKECRRQKIPIIFDEVFTGFWRLGAESAAELLGCVPDIACYAKLLTGGVVPLAATLATEPIFQAFEGNSKLFALLHGHSYSGHAIGCAAAVKAVQWFKDPQMNPNITSNGNRLEELWNFQLISEISAHPAIKRIVTLGTVCALELKADDCNAGYGSLLASALVQKLRDDGVYMRPLGNVIYLMCGPATPPVVCSTLLQKVCRRLDEC